MIYRDQKWSSSKSQYTDSKIYIEVIPKQEITEALSYFVYKIHCIQKIGFLQSIYEIVSMKYLFTCSKSIGSEWHLRRTDWSPSENKRELKKQISTLPFLTELYHWGTK